MRWPIANLPIRVRLTLWYFSVFAATLFCLGTACLWMVHRAVTEIEQKELQERVRSVRRFLEARPAGEPAEHLRAAMASAYYVSHGSKWLQVIDGGGGWVYRSPHVAAVYPALVLPGQAPAAGDYFDFSAEKGLHVTALIAPITVHGVGYTVQTGLTLDRTLAILSNLRVQLSLLTLLGLAVASLAGYFMSRKALSPIAAIAAEAQRINDRNLNLRLPELPTRDELAALSLTLNQMLGRIEAGYGSVRSFTANAAHELRSPVALLRAETEVALSFPRDAGYYRGTCEHVHRSALEMSRLIDQLLALARMDANIEPLERAPVNVADLLEELAGEWTERMEAAGIALALQMDETELWTPGDYLALRRLLVILIENAWRYTPAGGSVTLTARAEGTTVRVEVRDTGIGIARADQARVFERFCRVAQPVHGEFSGCGLGLALAGWIAEQHGASIAVESEPGVGSCFWFRLASVPLGGLSALEEAEASVAIG